MTTPLNLGAYELFISYSRKDNVQQKPGDAKGWVTALRDEILADHRRFSTEPLRIFFDTEEILSMDDWRHRILKGLRHSRILLVGGDEDPLDALNEIGVEVLFPPVDVNMLVDRFSQDAA